MQTIYLFCVFITILFRVIAQHAEFLRKCEKVKDIEFREECLRIASNFKDLTKYATPENTMPSWNSTLKKVNSICPPADVAERSSVTSIRSTSPWIYLNRTYPGILPENFLEAECICTGCLDFVNKKEDKLLVSKEIYVDEAILRLARPDFPIEECTMRRCRKIAMRRAIGCHCILV